MMIIGEIFLNLFLLFVVIISALTIISVFKNDIDDHGTEAPVIIVFFVLVFLVFLGSATALIML